MCAAIGLAVLMGGPLLGFVAGYVFYELFTPSSWVTPVAVGALCGLLFSWRGCRIIRARLQFTVEITPTEVHFGRGWLRSTFACEEVEVIRVGSESQQQPLWPDWLDITVRGERRRFFLEEQSADCACSLRERCPNAIYINLAGQEFVPVDTSRPFYVLKNLVRERRRRAIGMLALSGVGLFWAAPLLALAFYEMWTGQRAWSEVWKLWDWFITFLGGLVFLVTGVRTFISARRLEADAAQLKQRTASVKDCS